MEPVQAPGAGKPPAAAADPPKPADGEAPPAYVTDEQLQAALTTRFRSFEQKLDKALSDGLSTIGTRLRDELAALLPQREPAADVGETAPKPEGAAGAVTPATHAPSPELRKLQDQITLLTRQADEARAERDTERARARDSLLRQRVTDALSGIGIEGVRARHALGLLVDAEKRVRWSEDGGSVLFRTDAHDELDLGLGLREWLKTEDAKLYLPPRGAAGSGDRPGAQPPPARQPAGPVDRATVADGLRRALLGQL